MRRLAAVRTWLGLSGDAEFDEWVASSRRHSGRDWFVDIALFGFAALYWFFELNQSAPYYATYVDAWTLTADPWVGAIACFALWFRRRYPVLLTIAMVPALWIAATSTGAVLVAICTVAIHRSWRVAVLACLPLLAMSVPFAYVFPDPASARPFSVVFTALLFGAPLAWGIAIRSRRQVVAGLRRDAERTRREHALRLEDARRAERGRIAREMHDVLAHRISLLSVHAGALAYRTSQARSGAGPELDSAEVGPAVEVIRDSANQALTELAQVLSVLRADDTGEESGPQPRLVDIVRVIEDARSVGQDVAVDTDSVLDHADAAPPQLQRTAYRLVQEGLTNARKHASGGRVAVTVTGAPGSQLEVEVANPLPLHDGGGLPGASVGLTGLAERVELDGGTLEHGVYERMFRLRARLPWPDDRTGPGAAG